MGKNILIVGDTIVDKDINLQAIGLSLESPTIKTKIIGEKINFGGAANVAKYASLFGANVTFATAMSYESALHFTTKHNVKLLNLDNSIENTKSRFYVNHGDERYKHLQVNNTNNIDLNLDLDIDFNNYDVVAFSDYRCGLINDNMIKSAENCSAKTYAASQVSSHQPNFYKYEKLNFIVCNEKESVSVAKNKNVVITMGSKGCKLNNITYPTPDIKNPKNLIGAGDCFYAAFLVYEDGDKANYNASRYINGEI